MAGGDSQGIAFGNQVEKERRHLNVIPSGNFVFSLENLTLIQPTMNTFC